MKLESHDSQTYSIGRESLQQRSACSPYTQPTALVSNGDKKKKIENAEHNLFYMCNIVGMVDGKATKPKPPADAIQLIRTTIRNPIIF